jgi:hypothetical protein
MDMFGQGEWSGVAGNVDGVAVGVGDELKAIS